MRNNDDTIDKGHERYPRNDQVLECFNSRDSVSETPVHVINMNVVDNPEDATIGAFLLCELAQLLTSR